MSCPAVEVANILRAHEARFLDKNRSWLSFQRLTVLRAIARCRTAALGGHLDSDYTKSIPVTSTGSDIIQVRVGGFCGMCGRMDGL